MRTWRSMQACGAPARQGSLPGDSRRDVIPQARLRSRAEQRPHFFGVGLVSAAGWFEFGGDAAVVAGECAPAASSGLAGSAAA